MKAKIAIEAIKSQQTVQQIASQFGVHPTQVTQWKKQALEELPQVFSDRRSREASDIEEIKAELYQQIGQLQVELAWIKKKSGLSR
jgi:transposase-like protein